MNAQKIAGLLGRSARFVEQVGFGVSSTFSFFDQYSILTRLQTRSIHRWAKIQIARRRYYGNISHKAKYVEVSHRYYFINQFWLSCPASHKWDNLPINGTICQTDQALFPANRTLISPLYDWFLVDIHSVFEPMVTTLGVQLKQYAW